MRVVVLTSSRRGFASVCLPQLKQSGIEIAMVIFAEQQVSDRARARRRQLRKVMRIGILGAMNGIRMRRWYRAAVVDRLDVPEIEALTRQYGIRFERTPMVNCRRTRELMTEAATDLGLSLGNGYIGGKVFSIPPHGMINVHHEMLPQFQGAQSVIWQIHVGSDRTGYTIHRIDAGIDTGHILYQEEIPIVFSNSLQETVTANYVRLLEASSHGLVRVIQDFDNLANQARPQGPGRSFTTPSIWSFLRILWQHRTIRNRQKSGH